MLSRNFTIALRWGRLIRIWWPDAIYIKKKTARTGSPFSTNLDLFKITKTHKIGFTKVGDCYSPNRRFAYL